MVPRRHWGSTTVRRRVLLVIAGLLVVLLTGAARAADPSFAPSAVGIANANGVQVIDANGDGAADLAVTNAESNEVSVRLGDGKGGFATTGAPAKTGEAPVWLASADFNGDEKADLAVANVRANDVTVLLGDGIGGFQAAPGSPISVGGEPGRLTAADLNGDGHVDLAVPAYVTQKWQVAILLGDGSGRFGPGAPVARLGRYGSDTAAVADFNADRKADLAVSNTEVKGIFVLLGNGSGGFGAAKNVASGNYGGSLAVADLNRDGKPDLVGASLYSDKITVLLGRGGGAFRAAPGSPLVVAGYPHDIATADFDGDSKPDLAVENERYGSVDLLLGNGDGRFRQAGLSPFAAPLLEDVGFAGVADLNGDGKADLVTVGRPGVTILFQTAAAPHVARARAVRGADAVFSIRGRVTMLAADGSRAAVTTSVKHGCGRIVVWTAPGRRSTSVKPGFLGCSGDGVSELALGARRVAWIEEGGGNSLEMTVMAAKLGGAAKQIEYEANGDRAGGDPSGNWVGELFGGGPVLAYNSWTQTCDRGPDFSCGDYDPLLRVTGEKLVRIVNGRRTIVARGPAAYPLAAVGGGRMAVEAAGSVTIRTASGAQVARVPDPNKGARAVALSQTRLAIERTFTLDLYNPATSAAVKSLPLGPAAALRLEDVTSRLALLLGPRRLVLVRLSDGKLISLPPRSVAAATLVGGKLTEAGLFYAYNTRNASLPGRIVFEPMGKLLARF
jgi:VCBS repeat protein